MHENTIPERTGLVRLDEPAPDFKAASTHGDIRLSDYRGQWVVLFSHPADFTPVCTTEFVEFAKLQDEFDERDTQLIGLSVDSVYSHIAWVRDIEKHFDVKIRFPVIADLDTRVARLYGMIHPEAENASTVRCAFIIDDRQTIRAMIYYPLTVGRNIEEILRLLIALQTHDEHDVATPANWRPGEDVICKPPATQEEAESRLRDGYDSRLWYFTRKRV